MIKHQKPEAFYDTFERKGHDEKVTHYCPGCGHGTAQKLIAEAIDLLGIQDRVIFHSPVDVRYSPITTMIPGTSSVLMEGRLR